MVDDIKIEDRVIGLNCSPFIVAELSGNHNQSLDRALALVNAAANAGVDAVKLQTYTADTMTLDLKEREFFINDHKSLWHGKSLYELYKEAHTPWEWHKPIFERCRKLGLICFSTPFDDTAVNFLEGLGTPCYKIASFENTDTRLLRKVANTGKPVIISTGMASLSDLEETVNTIRKASYNNFVLLKCTSSYPASPKNANILTIPHLREMFNCHVGLSDHTLGIGVAIASVALGASVIEKHLTLNRGDGGVDSAFSLEPSEMKMLVKETKRAFQGLGKIIYGNVKDEVGSMTFRRSLYFVKDIEKGEKITKDNMRAIRPGYGLPVKYYDFLLGKKVKRDVTRGMALTWEIIE
jgi:pseudaminic acid synthase